MILDGEGRTDGLVAGGHPYLYVSVINDGDDIQFNGRHPSARFIVDDRSVDILTFKLFQALTCIGEVSDVSASTEERRKREERSTEQSGGY